MGGNAQRRRDAAVTKQRGQNAAPPTATSTQPGVAVTGYHFETHQGPLPSARSLREYEEVLPGLANRIVTMAEDEGRDRRWRMRYELRTGRFGLYAAFGVTALLLGAGVWLILQDKDLLGLSIIVGEIAAITWAYRRNRT